MLEMTPLPPLKRKSKEAPKVENNDNIDMPGFSKALVGQWFESF